MLTGHQKPSHPSRSRQPKSRHRQEGLGIGPLALGVFLVPQFQTPPAWAPLCLCSCFLSFKRSRRGSSAFVPFAFPPCSVFLSRLAGGKLRGLSDPRVSAQSPVSQEGPALGSAALGGMLRWPVPHGPLISNVLPRAICPAQSLWCKLCVLWLGWGERWSPGSPVRLLGLLHG